MNKSDYNVKAVCVVCQKHFLARYNVGKKAKTCTLPDHVCRRKVVKRPGRKDLIITCVEECCRSQYRKGAAAAAMDNAIDPRKVLSDEEFEATIKATKRLEDPEGVSLRFIAMTGCRLGEALLVRREAPIWMEGRYSVVKIPTLKRRSQGRPQRSVHVDNQGDFIRELKAWWKETKPGELLFQVARRTLQRALEKVLKKIKPERESLIHIFRHTRASQLIAAGATLNYVRQQLGWSSLEMAKIYAHTSEKEIVGVFDKMR